MQTVIMTSDKLPGDITFTYNEKSWLSNLFISECLSEKQYAWLFAHMPLHLDMIPTLSAKIPSATFVAKALQVTFDMFWDRYNDKERSSKKKTKTQWDKMSVSEQVKAYLFIPVYNRKRGTAEKKYATTYLSDELWNN